MLESKHRKGERGFTLVEVLIAMTILAIGLLAISEMQITALQATAFSHSISTTNSLARGVLDDILAWESDDPRLKDEGGNPHTWDFYPETGGVQDTVTLAGAGTYTATYTVVPELPVEKVVTITVTVRGGGISGLMAATTQRERTLIGLKRIQ